MKDLGITKGEWSLNTWEHQTDPSMRIGAKGTPMLCQVPSRFVSYNEQRANVKLIVDAGNTAQKCGLLPSELLEQRDELKRCVSKFADLIRCDSTGEIKTSSFHNDIVRLLEK